MFGNTNNNSNEVSVNTRIVTWYSDLSCLQIGCWNDKLSIKLNPIINIDEEGVRKYDFEKRISTAISQEKATILVDSLKKDVIPVIESISKGGRLENKIGAGFGVGKNSALFIEYDNDEKGTPSLYLVIYRDIRSDKTSDEVYRYKFNKTELVKNYNHKTGTGEELMSESEFFIFYRLLENLSDILGLSYHGSEYQNEYSSRKNKNNNYKGNSNSNQNYNQQYSAPTTNYDEDDELPF